MSWDSWVQNLAQYPGVNVAAICGLDGSVWAKTGAFNASQQELQALAGALGKSNAGEFPSFFLSGEKFMTIRLVDKEIDGKHGASSVSVMGSSQCFVIGGCIESAQQSDSGQLAVQGGGQKVNLAVSKTKEALANAGY